MNETLLGLVLGVSSLVAIGGLLFMNTALGSAFRGRDRTSRH